MEVEAAAKKPKMVCAVQADVSTEAGIALVISRTVETFGALDILVNNVGRAAAPTCSAPAMPSGRPRSIETLVPAIRASRLAIPYMKHAAAARS